MFPQSELRQLQNTVLNQNETVDLNQFPYWSLRSVLPLCTQLKAHIPLGTFYFPFNTITTEEEFYSLEKAIVQIASNELLLIPHLRATDELTLQRLKQGGFCLIDVEGESLIHYRNKDYTTYLRETVGGKRFREHQRLWRKSQDYSLKSVSINDVLNQPHLLESWSSLMKQHARKYGHTIAVYGSSFLNGIPSLPNKNEYGFHFRFLGESIIQVYLTRQVQETLYLIASASNPPVSAKGLNLYTTMMIDMIIKKDQLNLAFLHLGRGNKHKKRLYGANIYIPHVHAIYTKDKKAFAEIIKGDKTVCGM